MNKRFLLIVVCFVLILSTGFSQSGNDTVYHPKRNFLIEEVTGAWCRFCPRAPIIFNKQVKPHYPNVIRVEIHTGDAMKITEADSLLKTYVEVVPTGFVNRDVLEGYTNIALMPESWKSRLDDLQEKTTPVKVSVQNNYYPETRSWEIEVEAEFVVNSIGDYRFNIYVVEDSLTGSGPQWDQKNNYNVVSNEPYMELVGAGNPILGYVHNHVVRRMTGGSWGEDGLIPDSLSKGDKYVYSKSITIPDNWNPEHLHLIGMVHEHNDDIVKRPILNIEEAKLSYAPGTEPEIKENSINVYPNPVASSTILEIKTLNNSEFRFEIYNALGQSILDSDNLNIKGIKKYALNASTWTPGIYFVKTMIGETVEIIKLVKQ